jgi:spore cortex formation protein SpoVR/YcgB (stage V sporulation)
MSNKPLFDNAEWTIPLMEETWDVIDDYGRNWLQLDYNEPQFQITTADQMMSAYASVGLPSHYSHWSLGKSFINTKKDYLKGRSGLAYELIINSDPAIAYMMENNTMTMMALTMAHAAVGHSSVNKMNYMFKEWTRPGFILNYMKFAKDYIQQCEDKYGEDEVEWLLDRAHALKNHSIDRYQRGKQLKKEDYKQRYADLQEIRSNVSRTDKTIPGYVEKINSTLEERYIKSDYEERDRIYGRPLPEENLLYFIEKQSPSLKTWQREILRIVRRIAQYFYPQMEIHLLHEGWASFVHYTIMTQMWEDKYLTDGSYMEFLQSHTGVCYQPPNTAQLNPYKVGYAMFADLKRVCMEPDKEDELWFPDLCGTDWITSLRDIMINYKDQSFVMQYLGPKVIRELQLMEITHADDKYYNVNEVHDDEGVWGIRETLSNKYGLAAQRMPIAEVVDYIPKKHACHIRLLAHENMRFNGDQTVKTMRYIEQLWGNPQCRITMTTIEKDK